MAETILERWGISQSELTEVIDSNPSLRGMLTGYVAELKLTQTLRVTPGVTSVTKDDDHDRRKKGDHRLTYRGHEFVIETKSLQTNSIRQQPDGTYSASAQCDASDRREVALRDGTKLTTTNLLVGEFDILAISMFAITGAWDFAFALNRDLPRSRYRGYTTAQQEELLATLVPVTWPLPATGFLTSDLSGLLSRAARARQRS